MPCETDLLARVHPSIYSGQTLIQTSDTIFWDTIFSIDATSAEVLSSITTLLHSPSKGTEARSLQANRAQNLIELIDQVSDPGGLAPVPRVLTMGFSSSHHNASIRSCLGGARDYSTRSAKPTGYYPRRTTFTQNSSVLASMGGVAALRT